MEQFYNSILSWNSLINSALQSQQRMMMNYLRNASGYQHDARDIAHAYFRFYSKIAINPVLLNTIRNEIQLYFDRQQELFYHAYIKKDQTDFISAHKNDKRFLHPDWKINPFYNYIKQSYLLFSELNERVFKNLKSEEINKEKICFYSSQFINAFSPSNFLFTNPETMQLFIESNGESIIKGMKNFSADLLKGKITQVNENAFEKGKTVATSEGAVIFENELMQLIQYQVPQEKKWSIPLLIIPPWINKFYILDLQKKNSFVSYLAENGFQVFMLSWVNPQHGMGNISFDDYVSKGTITAIETVLKVTKSEKLNLLGYCLGGTLVGITASVLKKRKRKAMSFNQSPFLLQCLILNL